MNAQGLLALLDTQGVRLAAEGERLRVDSPSGVITPELKDILQRLKPEVLRLLAERRRTAFAVWETAVREVAGAWEAWAARLRAAGVEPPDLCDSALRDGVRDAIKAGDLQRTLEAAGRWRAAWAQVFEAPPQLGWGERVAWEAGTTSSSLSGCTSPKPTPSLRTAAARLPAPDLSEWLDAPEPLRREAAHREFLTRADQVIADSEGRRAPPNSTVHAMFAGSQVSDERSLTVWLRRHAPQVAALWPEAPLGASWFDWRLQVGPEAMPALDQAWSAILGMPAPWKAESLGEEKDKKP